MFRFTADRGSFRPGWYEFVRAQRIASSNFGARQSVHLWFDPVYNLLHYVASLITPKIVRPSKSPSHASSGAVHPDFFAKVADGHDCRFALIEQFQHITNGGDACALERVEDVHERSSASTGVSASSLDKRLPPTSRSTATVSISSLMPAIIRR